MLRLWVPERIEQRGALAAVCTPTIKSASEKHQSDWKLYDNLNDWNCVVKTVYRPGVIDQKSKLKSTHSKTPPKQDVAQVRHRPKIQPAWQKHFAEKRAHTME